MSLEKDYITLTTILASYNLEKDYTTLTTILAPYNLEKDYTTLTTILAPYNFTTVPKIIACSKGIFVRLY